MKVNTALSMPSITLLIISCNLSVCMATRFGLSYSKKGCRRSTVPMNSRQSACFSTNNFPMASFFSFSAITREDYKEIREIESEAYFFVGVLYVEVSTSFNKQQRYLDIIVKRCNVLEL